MHHEFWGIAMRVFIMGGSGLIGSAIVRNLLAHGHDVLALARNSNRVTQLEAAGAKTLWGDIADPAHWCSALPTVDAAIHAACDFTADMTAIDANLLDHLIPSLSRSGNRPRFIYTGGTWLYPDIGTRKIPDNENSAFDPVSGFEWMITGLNRILSEPDICGMVIHPGCVYGTDPSRNLGALSRNITEACGLRPLTIPGRPSICHTMVHTDDLADLYRLMLENGAPGQSYLGVAINGLSVGKLARKVAQYFGQWGWATLPVTTIIDPAQACYHFGSWANGLFRNQYMTSDRATNDLGWSPRHIDIDADLATISTRLRSDGKLMSANRIQSNNAANDH